MASIEFETRVKGGFPVLVRADLTHDEYCGGCDVDVEVMTLKGKSCGWLKLSKADIAELETEAQEVAARRCHNDDAEDAAESRAEYQYQQWKINRYESRFH